MRSALSAGQFSKFDLREIRSFSVITHQGVQIHVFDPFGMQNDELRSGIKTSRGCQLFSPLMGSKNTTRIHFNS